MNTTPTESLDHFELSLLAQLREFVADRHDSRTDTSARRHGRILLSAAVAVGVVGLGTIAMTGRSAPAFAMEYGDSGAVVVRIHQLADAEGLEAALAARGVTAEVDYAGGAPGPIAVDVDGGVVIGSAPAIDGGPPPGGESSAAGRISSGSGADGSAGSVPPADADLCATGPDGSPPIALAREDGDYIVRLSGASLGQDNSLRLTTIGGDRAEALVASYRFGELTCGAMVMI